MTGCLITFKIEISVIGVSYETEFTFMKYEF